MTTNTEESIRLRKVAEAAALSVGDYLREAFHSKLHVDTKRDIRDVVTEADKESEVRVSKYIMDHEPDSTILGEEGGQKGEGRIQWFIDPIDGTGNFSTNVPFWCVSIAAAVDDVVIAAAVYDPVRDEMYSADANGAYLNGEVIRAEGRTDESRALLTTNFPAPRQVIKYGDAVLQQWGELVREFFAVKRIGSAALSLCYIANARFDATMSTGVNAWDVAAASYILKQAGGQYYPLLLDNPDDPDYLSPIYYGTVNGGEYPTLDKVGKEFAELVRQSQ